MFTLLATTWPTRLALQRVLRLQLASKLRKKEQKERSTSWSSWDVDGRRASRLSFAHLPASDTGAKGTRSGKRALWLEHRLSRSHHDYARPNVKRLFHLDAFLIKESKLKCLSLVACARRYCFSRLNFGITKQALF